MPTAFIFAFILLTSHASAVAVSLPNTPQRLTRRDDIIGIYARHPQTALIADDNFCPDNITIRSYEFQPDTYPTIVQRPRAHNIRIPFTDIRIVNRRCDSFGSISAVTYDHPFIDDPVAAVQAWAGVGSLTNTVPWLVNSSFVNGTALDPWVIGYDFDGLHCGRYIIPPGAYYWIQPSTTQYINNVKLVPTMKYLVVTFSGDRIQGCLFNALIVGGQGSFKNGPVSDVSNPSSPKQPEPLGQWSASPSPASGIGQSSDSNSSDASATEEPDVTPPMATEMPTAKSPPSDSSSSGPTVFGNSSSSSEDQKGPGSTSRDPAACFPRDAVLTMHNADAKPMFHVKIGDRVRVSETESSEVFFFSHRDDSSDRLFDFVELSLESGHRLRISRGHYVYTSEAELVESSRVRAWKDSLVLQDGSVSRVVATRMVKDYGLFAPHTMHGDIVVDGVRVSTYTTAVHPWVAHHILLAPVRMLFRLGLVNFLQPVFKNGAPLLAQLMPGGSVRLKSFL